MELLLLLPPMLNYNVFICKHTYTKKLQKTQASRTNRWQNREVSSYEPEIPVTSAYDGTVRSYTPTDYRLGMQW